jgi:histone chaperone ASF1
MSLISVTNVEILNNPTKFTSPFQFEISFECISPVKEGEQQQRQWQRAADRAQAREHWSTVRRHAPSTLLTHSLRTVLPRVVLPRCIVELEWKLVYVGSAEDEQFDQELDSVLVGPIIVGKNKFVFEAAPPDATLIPTKDIMEVTVLLLTCAYKEKEFIRIGYYVNTEYEPVRRVHTSSAGPPIAPLQHCTNRVTCAGGRPGTFVRLLTIPALIRRVIGCVLLCSPPLV